MKKQWIIFLKNILWQAKLILSINLVGLIFLGISQSILIFILGPVVQLFFQSSADRTVINTQQLFHTLPPVLLSHIPNYEMNLSDWKVWVPILILIAGSVRAIALFIFLWSQEGIGLNVAQKIREKIFANILDVPFLTVTQKTPSEWMSLLMNDVMLLQARFIDVFGSLSRDFLTMMISLGMMLWINVTWFLGFLLFSPLFIYFLGIISKRIAVYAQDYQEKQEKLQNHILGIRSRYDFMRANRGENLELLNYKKFNQDYFKDIMQSVPLRGIFAPGLEFFGFIIFSIFLWYSGRAILSGDISSSHANDFIPFVLALGFMLKPLKNIGEQLTKVREIQGAIMRHSDWIFFASPQKIKQVADREIKNLTTIKINQVDFRYPHSNEKNLSIQNIHFEPGQSYLIMGPNGSGKSTFAKILSGLIYPDKWDSNGNWQDVTSQTILVSQHPFLFKGTLRENLLYGCREKYSQEYLIKILKLVAMEISELENGLDTEISNFQRNISGGQIHRIAIARALLQNKNILILDEPGASLDKVTEKKIMNHLLQINREQKKILIVISHHMDDRNYFDKVINLAV